MTKEEQREKLYHDVLNACDELGYTVISDKSEFINNNSMIKYICPIHGVQEKSATGLKQRKRCALCANQIRNKKAVLSRSINNNSKEKYYSEALDICINKGYMLLSDIGEFTGYKSYIRYSCSKHGEQTMRFGNLVSGRSCPECRKEAAREQFSMCEEDVINRVESCGGKLLNPSDYVNQSVENLRIECPKCHKNIVVTSLAHFVQHGGKVCSECYKKESNGERAVRNWLEEHNINYEAQKPFSDCKDIRPLLFDFYLPDENKIIEFDGMQHFKNEHFFNHNDPRFDSSLSYIQYHDEIKNNYCKANGIDLLRIPYYLINSVGTLLNDFLTA